MKPLKTNKIKDLSTSSLEKSGELVSFPKEEDFRNPYGKHISAVNVDIFEKGLYISVMNGTQCKFSKFVAIKENTDNVGNEKERNSK